MPNRDDKEWLSEEEAHRLLARAADLDARGMPSIWLDQLRAAAKEAWISPESFARALTDLRAGKLEPPTVGQSLSARLVRYRRHAFLASWVLASFATRGDIVSVTLELCLAMFGAYEGVALLARWMGRHPPTRATPPATREPAPSRQGNAPPDGSAMLIRLVALRGRSALAV